MTLKSTIAILLLSIKISVTFAQRSAGNSDTYLKAHPTEQFALKSTYVPGREFKMHITYAMDSLIPGKKYPVLYYTDGYGTVDLFHIIGGLLSLGKEIDPVILVGITYEAQSKERGKLRATDFLPNLMNPDTINGAKNFLNFIKKELIPYMENNYPVDFKDRGLFGYSYGALFATWVLKEDPSLFTKWGLASPSLWYKEFGLLKDTKLSDNIKNAVFKKVFVEYGSMEAEDQKSGAESLFKMINANKNIQSVKVILDGTHLSALPAACSKGLSYLYERTK